MNEHNTQINYLLSILYGKETATEVQLALVARMDAFRDSYPQLGDPACSPSISRMGEGDVILVTYGDQFREPGQPPLRTLRAFLDDHLHDAISGVHILPCFPYSSDDGFSVIDYLQVDPDLGDWDDVAALGDRYRLMFDFVANHISQYSTWFDAFRRGEDPYTGYFVTVEPSDDLSQVVRPRALPLITSVETVHGLRHVWTTFSTDQIDLNYANPRVFLEMTDVLLHYVAQGAEIIRLDAIAYLWKQIGTPCIHLPQTHAVVKLWRAVLDVVAPQVLLITETNVPHADNISYFGMPLVGRGSTDEAQMVYNFSLAPLTLHTFLTGDAILLSRWAAGLKPPSPGATFFNFIASHDGIGVMPARGFLDEAQVQHLADRTLAHSGQVSYKANPDGSVSVYELNITLYDFLNDPAHPEFVDVRRFLTSQAILLSLAGVPGIYVHSLFGSRNCYDCFVDTGRARSLNRHKFDRAVLEKALTDPAQHAGRVFDGYNHMLKVRRKEPAFHPTGGQKVLDMGSAVFAVLRTPPQTGRPVLCLHSVSPHMQTVHLGVDLFEPCDGSYYDLLTDAVYAIEKGAADIELAGYQTCWLVYNPTGVMIP